MGLQVSQKFDQGFAGDEVDGGRTGQHQRNHQRQQSARRQVPVTSQHEAQPQRDQRTHRGGGGRHHPVARRLAVGDRVQAALREVRAPASQVQQPESLLAGHVERT
ncbi:hypothetical protein [Pseudoxanthomonas mexicana]